MEKKLILLFAAVVIFCTLGISCARPGDKNKNIIDDLKDLKSYSCNMDIQVKNSKQKIDYSARQIYSVGLGYRLELNKDRTMVYKGNKIYIKDYKNNSVYTTDKSFDDVYRLSFIGEYIGLLYTDENIKYSFTKVGDEEYELIKLKIPSNNKNLSNAVLHVNTKTKVPSKLFIYDFQGNEVMEITYKDFKANDQVTADLFEVK
ncbi:MAG: germination lipoprotein GerS-related protein [Bacillota bacterium]|nr:germination lipoprotein GerS-related protein [Bacillota bacterium]